MKVSLSFCKSKLAILIVLLSGTVFGGDIYDRVSHHYASNDGVKIHYVSVGEGPVLILLHGFPDFWYSWRYQMEHFAKNNKVVAVDLRGYNLSDKPSGVGSYAMSVLMKDIIAVIDDLKLKKATIIANDWGGAIAWQLATFYPNRVERLVACNIPHPAAISAYLAKNPTTGQYAQDFKKPGAENSLSAESLAGLHTVLNQRERARYVEAFKRSSFTDMLNYYRANYPSPPKKRRFHASPDCCSHT